MIEVSTSILSVKKGEESKTFFGLEKAKTDLEQKKSEVKTGSKCFFSVRGSKNRLFPYRCYGWKICREKYI